MTTATASTTQPHIRIRPTSPWLLPLEDLWRFRELLLTLGVRDIKVRYKQTALGVLWVVLQPLLGAGIFTFIFGKVADLPVENGVPYFLASFAGLQAYSLFSSTLNKASNSLVGNAHLVSKIYFPRLILPLSTFPTTLVDFGVAMAMLAVMMAVWAQAPGPALLLLPIWIAGVLGLGLGLGLIAAAMAVHYRDVKYVVPVLTQFLIYAAPIGYTVTAMARKLEEPWMVQAYLLNPLAPLIEGFRWSLLGTNPPPVGFTILAFGVSLLMLALGAMWFTRMERRLADVI